MTPDSLPLRDIQLPDAISWWPLATGWWVALILLLLLVVLFIWLWRFYRRRRLLRAALRQLRQYYRVYRRNSDTAQFIGELSLYCHRLMRHKYGYKEKSALSGTAWLQQLDSEIGGKQFSSGVGKILADGPYMRTIECKPAPLLRLLRKLTKKILTGKGVGHA